MDSRCVGLREKEMACWKGRSLRGNFDKGEVRFFKIKYKKLCGNISVYILLVANIILRRIITITICISKQR